MNLPSNKIEVEEIIYEKLIEFGIEYTKNGLSIIDSYEYTRRWLMDNLKSHIDIIRDNISGYISITSYSNDGDDISMYIEDITDIVKHRIRLEKIEELLN